MKYYGRFYNDESSEKNDCQCSYCQIYRLRGKRAVDSKGFRIHNCYYDNCNKTFRAASALRTHLWTHTGVRPYGCQIPKCGKKYYHEASLKYHMLVHAGEQKFLCDVCGYKSGKKHDLMMHVLNHKKRSYACDFPGCVKAFFDNAQLRRHLLVHYGEKNYVCDLCKYCSVRKDHLKQHMESHQGKGYVCQTCGLAFSHKYGFNKHVYIHEKTSEDRLYTCLFPNCGKKFLKRSHYKSHKQIHSGAVNETVKPTEKVATE